MCSSGTSRVKYRKACGLVLQASSATRSISTQSENSEPQFRNPEHYHPEEHYLHYLTFFDHKTPGAVQMLSYVQDMFLIAVPDSGWPFLHERFAEFQRTDYSGLHDYRQSTHVHLKVFNIPRSIILDLKLRYQM